MLRDILMKGIGIHHGDLLHIGKEIVEILLQKGLVKVLFATDSFAMGLNMPTKTVVFNGIKKFDGKEMRYLLSSEYTQMSGRAGRRGLDDKGKVIAFFSNERDLPKPIDYETMTGTKGESLKSKFKMSYSILFNALSSQVVELDEIMKKSFGENTNVLNLKDLKKNRDELFEKIGDKKIECEFVPIEDAAPIFSYRELGDNVYNIANNFYNKLFLAKEMRLPKFVRLLDSNYNTHIALLLRYNKSYKNRDEVHDYDAIIVRSSKEERPKPRFTETPKPYTQYHNGLPYLDKYEFKVLPMEIMTAYFIHTKTRYDQLEDD